MSMPEHDDFFHQLGKKLDTEWSFNQYPEEWAQVAAQIPTKPARKKFTWWWWLLLLLLSAGNIAWYRANRQLRNELKETTSALVAARQMHEKSAAAATDSRAESPAGPAENKSGNGIRLPQKDEKGASSAYLKHRLQEAVFENSDTATTKSIVVQQPDSVPIMANVKSKKILFPIPLDKPFFTTKPNLYLIHLQDGALASTTPKEKRRPGNWKLNPLIGYAFMEFDSQPRTGGLQFGLDFSRRIVGHFSISAGLSQRTWQFGLDNPASPLINAKDESCPYCPTDTILVSRKQWSSTLALSYEKDITNWLGIQLGAGWSYVPKFDQRVTYRYIPVYGGSHLTITEREIRVPAYNLAHVRAGLVFPTNSRIAGVLAGQYDFPLKTGKVGWWALQAGWQITF
jgi:hypothetical protein